MASGVLMPKAGITVEECIISKWEKKVGDKVNVGDVLFNYETDKASFECESTAAGEILAIFFEDGAEVPVLVNVCAVGEQGEDFSSLAPNGGAKPQEAAPVQEEKAAETSMAAALSDEPSATAAYGGRVSPRARRLAEKQGIDPSFALPSGPYGRIIERDIRTLLENRNGSGIGGRVLAAEAQAPAAPVLTDEIEYTDVKFTKIRSTIAKAMSASLSGMAQLTHHHSFDATQILDYRKALKTVGESMGLPNITLNDMVLFAVSRVLLNHPDLNANMVGADTIRHFKDVHLGVAVDTPRGLMVPTIFFANHKSLAEISAEAKQLIKEAQSGTINPDKLRGGTFTVSNLGALGVEMFTPVINPPQTGILGVCNVTTRLKPAGNDYKPYQAMGLSLTYDHRAVDGAPASRFAKELCEALENFGETLKK